MVYVTETLIVGFFIYLFIFTKAAAFNTLFFFLLYFKKKNFTVRIWDEKKAFSFRKLLFTFYLCTGNHLLDFCLLLDAILCVFNAVPCFSSRQLTGKQKQSTANFNLSGRTFYTQQKYDQTLATLLMRGISMFHIVNVFY